MGKNAQRRRGEDGQPQIDHFIMNGDTFVAIRRFLGSRPHDETRQLITLLEQMPAVTTQDLEVREKASKRLAELEELQKNPLILEPVNDGETQDSNVTTDEDLKAPEDESDRLPDIEAPCGGEIPNEGHSEKGPDAPPEEDPLKRGWPME